MRHARRSSVVLLLALLALVLAGPFASESFADKGELDEKAMKKKMNGWARELGVKCLYRHIANGREMETTRARRRTRPWPTPARSASSTG